MNNNGCLFYSVNLKILCGPITLYKTSKRDYYFIELQKEKIVVSYWIVNILLKNLTFSWELWKSFLLMDEMKLQRDISFLNLGNERGRIKSRASLGRVTRGHSPVKKIAKIPCNADVTSVEAFKSKLVMAVYLRVFHIFKGYDKN